MQKRSSIDVPKVTAPLIDSAIQKVDSGAPQKNPAAVALGRLGGLKGGHARAAVLSQRQRSEIARKAAKSRWSKEKEQDE